MTDANKYPVEVFFSQEDEGYIAITRDLPGCSAFGDTAADAVAEIQHAIEAWKAAATAAGNPIPEPSTIAGESRPSGKILLRIPKSLHSTLIECAKKEGVSLNQHLVSVLSASTATHLLMENALKQMVAEFEIRERAAASRRRAVFGGGLAVAQMHDVGFLKVLVREPTFEAVVQTRTPLDLRNLPAGIPVVVREEGR